MSLTLRILNLFYDIIDLRGGVIRGGHVEKSDTGWESTGGKTVFSIGEKFVSGSTELFINNTPRLLKTEKTEELDIYDYEESNGNTTITIRQAVGSVDFPAVLYCRYTPLRNY